MQKNSGHSFATKVPGYLRLLACAMCIVFVVLLVAGVGCSNEQESDVFELRFAHVLPPVGAYSEVDQWFADEIESRTNGRVKIEIGWSNSFGGIQELPGMLRVGALDFALYAPGFDPQRFPIWGFVNDPGFKFDSLTEADEVARMLIQEFPEAEAEFTSLGTRLVFTHHGTNDLMMGNREVRGIEDFKGAKIRADGEFLPKAFRAVGAVPVSLLPPEYYESVERGVIDLMLNTLTAMVDSHSLHEVSKYLITATTGYMIGPQILVSTKTLEKLPDDVVDIIFEVGSEAQNMDLSVQTEYEQNALETVRDAGVEIIIFPEEDQVEWKNLAPNSVAEWIAGMEANSSGELARRIVNRIQEITGQFELDTSLYQQYE